MAAKGGLRFVLGAGCLGGKGVGAGVGGGFKVCVSWRRGLGGGECRLGKGWGRVGEEGGWNGNERWGERGCRYAVWKRRGRCSCGECW